APRPPAALGYEGLRGPPDGGQPAGGVVLPARLAGVVVAVAGRAGVAHRRAPCLGGDRGLRPFTRIRSGPVRADRGGRLFPGVALRPRAYVRGALSARLGRVLVSLGVPGRHRAPPGPCGGRPGPPPDPGALVPDRPPPGVVLPGLHARRLD